MRANERDAAKRRGSAAAALGLLLFGCAELPALAPGVCGNGVVDDGEQCDLAEDPSLGKDLRCADPSDTVRACHYVCSPNQDAFKCPTGWGCGADGVCHYASGMFEEADESPLDFNPYTRLDLADFDGDGRPDLLTSAVSGVSVHFSRRDGSFSTTYDFGVHNVAGATAVGDLDGDGNADVVVESLHGPIVLRGQRNHTLAPVIFSRIPTDDVPPGSVGRLLSLGLAPIHPPPGDCAGAVADLGILATLAFERSLALVVQKLSVRAVIAPFDGATAGLPSVVVRDIDGDGADEVVLAPAGKQRLFVYALTCGSDGHPTLTLKSDLRLPFGAALLGGSDASTARPNVLVADVDGDSWLDVLVAVEDPSTPGAVQVAVARGGASGLARPEIDHQFDVLGSGTAASLGPIAVGADAFPFAAGDLDGNSTADYVAASGIYVAAGPNHELASRAGPRQLSTWSAAVMDDLDGDGLLDVAAVSDQDSVVGLEIYLSASTATRRRVVGETPSHLVTTVGRPSALRTADFDGDGLKDLAFLESGVLGDTTLSVVYGGTASRISMGSPGEIVGLAPGDLRNDGEDDLVMVMRSTTASGSSLSAGVLYGAPERRLLSPIPLDGLVASVDAVEYSSARLMLARFAGDDPNLDLVVFDQEQFVLLPGTGAGSFALDKPQAKQFYVRDMLPGVGWIRSDCVHFLAANVDPSSADDEMISVAGRSCFLPDVALGLRGSSSGGGAGTGLPEHGQILIVGGRDGGLPRKAKIDLPDAVEPIVGAWTMDLDKNGVPEIVIASGGPEDIAANTRGGAAIDPSQAASAVRIFWNVAVTFPAELTAEPTIATSGTTLVPLDGLGTTRAIAAINTDRDEAMEVALLLQENAIGGTDNKAAVYVLDLGSPSDFSVSTRPVFEETLSSLGTPELLATDVDSDGLEDLLLGDGAVVYVYRALADHQGGR